MNKGLVYGIAAVGGLILVYLIFGKKKTRRRNYSRRRNRSAARSGRVSRNKAAGRSNSNTSTTRRVGKSLSKKVLKEAGLNANFSNYENLTAKQKQLYNLAKGRLNRKKAKK